MNILIHKIDYNIPERYIGHTSTNKLVEIGSVIEIESQLNHSVRLTVLKVIGQSETNNSNHNVVSRDYCYVA